MLESLDEFEILPDLTTDHRFSCPLGSKKSMILLFLVCYLSDPFKFVGIKDMHNTYYLGLSGERSLSFGLLVKVCCAMMTSVQSDTITQ